MHGPHDLAGFSGGARRADGFRFFGHGFFGDGEGSLAFQEGQGGLQEDRGVSLAAPEVSLGLAGLDDGRLEGWLAPICRELLRQEGICAVFYDLTHKPPGTIEWE